MGTTTNTTVTAFTGSVRVKRVEIWAVGQTLGTAITCSVLWAGTTNSADVEVSDTSVSTAAPAHINSRPPRNSLASFWNIAGTQTLFSLVAPAGCIIDVEVEQTLFDDDNGSNATVSVATAVVGTVYYLSLDPNATHRYAPISLTTTT